MSSSDDDSWTWNESVRNSCTEKEGKNVRIPNYVTFDAAILQEYKKKMADLVEEINKLKDSVKNLEDKHKREIDVHKQEIDVLKNKNKDAEKELEKMKSDESENIKQLKRLLKSEEKRSNYAQHKVMEHLKKIEELQKQVDHFTKPGWECITCNFTNHYSRTICLRCVNEGRLGNETMPDRDYTSDISQNRDVPDSSNPV